MAAVSRPGELAYKFTAMSEPTDSDVQQLWATPVFNHLFEGTEALNARLAEIILEMERLDAGINRSVRHGWHSKEDLFDWPYPEVAHMRDMVRTGMLELTKATTGLEEGEFTGNAEFLGWATVLRKGAFNNVHTHPDCVWSGAYYVATGGAGGADAAGGGDGVIEFHDPRMGVEMVSTPGDPFGQRLRFEPETGRMIMFPAWLRHGVTPYRGDGIRITIAFNVRFANFRVLA